MIARLIKKSKIYNFTLPNKISGNYWITDKDYLGNVRNLINVEAENGKWKIKSDFETKIMNGDQEIESAILQDYSLYFLKINTDNEYVILYCSPSIEKENITLHLRNQGEIIIGNQPNANISYAYPLVSQQHARLIFNNNQWIIEDLNSKYGTYVNNSAVTSTTLEYGDIIFIMGLKIIVMDQSIVINSIGNYINFDRNIFQIERPLIQNQTQKDNPDEETIEFFKEEDYFYKAPRFKTKIEPVEISIESPPQLAKEQKTPLILTLAPMLSMAMMSLTSGFKSLIDVLNGAVDFKEAMPALMTSGGMICTMIVLPMVSQGYQKKQTKKQEKMRLEKYKKYIGDKKEELKSTMKIQKQILIDNYLPLSAVKDIIYSRKRNLWEREIDQEDFLDLRLGLGNLPLVGKVNYPTQNLMMESDELTKEVEKMGNESRVLENVPISLSFVKKNISAIIGMTNNKKGFIDGLLLQMLAFHSYEDLKIVIFTNEKNESQWQSIKVAPHNWSNNKEVRYFASNLDDSKSISLVLEKILQARKYKDVNGNRQTNSADYKHHKPYYVIFTDDYKEIRDLEIIKDVCESDINYGFSLIVSSPRLINIPNECKTFISLGDKKSGVFENELVSNKQKEFVADFDPSINLYECCKKLANIPIDIVKEDQNLPTTITFLEMYNVGMVEQLNVLNRWKQNDPTKSLQAPVGVDKSQELFKLDLHEKFHGPHGLIAGMTGSGKSEFIITYILSMALNYHPYEVSFVLIDYKGGGLAGAFENKETGMKLPHLAGTITNLDTVEMNRSLASIQSELRKRQRMFNEARDKLNESTIDIYKYQTLYRKGMVSKPISHLFIISDEFAELKAQRPEFMDQLISTARIGRSLGVHLILATQKPAGVVNDQIWSNSKFRVCLKVQDKSDSQDMIKCPDAANLKETGRFYLQVGYNELFALGQAAWAGAKYYPTEKRKKKVDQSVNIVDNVGNVLKSLDPNQNQVQIKSSGEEITNIIQYIIKEAATENISIDQLWLDRIPNVIYSENLKKKYNYHRQKNVINPIIGEYDDPDNQRQNLLTLPLSKEGNTIIYGSGGSGKNLMLSSIIYSMITNHTSDELNIYILDFGSETMTMFKNAPQVGEVLLAPEKEKICNLFKLINQTIEERKKKFVDYNGSYDFYINHGGKQIPMLVIFINNTEAFLEAYEDYEEMLGQITRDCLKYGVVFVFTTNSPNGIRYRIRQNFRQNLVLQFNDSSDYGSVLSGVRKKEPSKAYGRGLIDIDNIYEFQTAYPYKEEKMTDYIKIISNKLNQICKTKARKVPILPEVVTNEDVIEKIGSLKNVPIGISKETLEIGTIDLEESYMFNITGEDITSLPNFIYSFINLLVQAPNTSCIVVDALKILSEKRIESDKIGYGDTDFKTLIGQINAIYEVKKLNNTPEETICVIIGVKSLLQKLSPTEKSNFTSLLSNASNLGTLKFVLIDNIDSIKTLAYESWFKENADLGEGIWIGNGISNQFTLKVTTNSRLLRTELEPNFGYIIHKGKTTLVKFITND